MPLSFSMQGDQVLTRAPLTRDIAPPGHYMLFAVDSAGVPSTASIILLGQPLLSSGDVVVNALLPEAGASTDRDEFVLNSTEG